jgi:hypothetical protein
MDANGAAAGRLFRVRKCRIIVRGILQWPVFSGIGRVAFSLRKNPATFLNF